MKPREQCRHVRRPKVPIAHAEFSAQEFPPIYSPPPEFENENSPSSKQTGPFFRAEEDLVAAKDLSILHA
jgi:hypothetical protein